VAAVHLEDALDLSGDVERRALERVVERLADAEEALVAGDNLPPDVQPEAPVDRDHRAQ